MDLTEYRENHKEQERITDLLRIAPKGRSSVLEIGARDGYISKLLAQNFKKVTALDLEKPELNIENVIPVKGDVTGLDFDDNSFDAVYCSEVLEHIPTKLLEKACGEIIRVARYDIIIGVPYKQDIRIGRTTCCSCGRKNPPWGHLNSFDEGYLKKLFNSVKAVSTTYVGSTRIKTNPVSRFLMDLAGNPWGTYSQEEPCVHCGKKLIFPPARRIYHKLCAKSGFILNKIQEPFVAFRPIWIHMLFKKAEFSSKPFNQIPLS